MLFSRPGTPRPEPACGFSSLVVKADVLGTRQPCLVLLSATPTAPPTPLAVAPPPRCPPPGLLCGLVQRTPQPQLREAVATPLGRDGPTPPHTSSKTYSGSLLGTHAWGAFPSPLSAVRTGCRPRFIPPFSALLLDAAPDLLCVSLLICLSSFSRLSGPFWAPRTPRPLGQSLTRSWPEGACEHWAAGAPRPPAHAHMVLEARLVSSCLSFPSRARPRFSRLSLSSGVTVYTLQNVELGDTWSLGSGARRPRLGGVLGEEVAPTLGASPPPLARLCSGP